MPARAGEIAFQSTQEVKERDVGRRFNTVRNNNPVSWLGRNEKCRERVVLRDAILEVLIAKCDRGVTFGRALNFRIAKVRSKVMGAGRGKREQGQNAYDARRDVQNRREPIKAE